MDTVTLIAYPNVKTKLMTLHVQNNNILALVWNYVGWLIRLSKTRLHYIATDPFPYEKFGVKWKGWEDTDLD